MAAIASGNTLYFVVGDSATTAIDDKNIMVVGAVITALGGAGACTLADNISGASYPAKLSLDVGANGSTYIDLSNTPIVFPNGIRIKLVTGTPAVTLIIRRPQ